MNTAVLILLVVAAASAMPEATVKPVNLVSQSDVRSLNGDFIAKYQTDDGQVVVQTGKAVPNADNTDTVINLAGEYSYVSPNGELVKVTYTADETGFHPEGTHIPKN